MSDVQTKKIFPPNKLTKHYIVFARLRPKISDTIPGEELFIEATMEIATASEDSAFNVTSTCSYEYTPDPIKQGDEWRKQNTSLKKTGVSDEVIEYEKENWYLNDAKRYFKENSFDFRIESLGVFSNKELLMKACDILIQKGFQLKKLLETQKLDVQDAETTMPFAYDIWLKNENYTFGKCIEYALHLLFYKQKRVFNFVGFRKDHPYDTDSLIRVAFSKSHTKNDLLEYLNISSDYVIHAFQHTKKLF